MLRPRRSAPARSFAIRGSDWLPTSKSRHRARRRRLEVRLVGAELRDHACLECVVQHRLRDARRDVIGRVLVQRERVWLRNTVHVEVTARQRQRANRPREGVHGYIVGARAGSLRRAFARALWAWLQDPEIKRLTDTPDSHAAQRSWFESLGGRTDYFVWRIEVDGAPIGAFGLKHVTLEDAEYRAYLGERAHWGCGIGQWMLDRACHEARVMRLRRLHQRELSTTHGRSRRIGVSASEPTRSRAAYVLMSIEL